MVFSQSTATTSRRVEFRGLERYMTVVDGVSNKVVHSMRVSGSSTTAIQQLVRAMPIAIMNTFNKHPRMRALQLRDEPETAEIQPHITLDQVIERSLLRIHHIPTTTENYTTNDSHIDSIDDWQDFVRRECDIHFDRYSQLPFYLVVWEADDIAQLMLFSDHFMSDGYSGMVILDNVLTEAAKVVRQGSEVRHEPVDELPLLPSMYHAWLDSMPFTKFASKMLVTIGGVASFRRESSAFHPMLPPRKDLPPFKFPLEIGSTFGLFADSDRETSQRVLAACRQQNVTFTGALVAAVTLAFYIVRQEVAGNADPDASNDDAPFRLSLDVDYNMRGRVVNPPQFAPVGMWNVFQTQGALGGEGVDLKATRFWDCARSMKKEIDRAPANTFSMSIQTLFLDRYFRRGAEEQFRGLSLPHPLSGDVNVSSIGRYPYAITHSLGVDGDTTKDSIKVERFHVYNTSPIIGSGATVFVSCTDAFSYSLAHKYDADVGARLLRLIVALCERVPAIDDSESMIDIARQVQAHVGTDS